jgi:hypothetical protein
VLLGASHVSSLFIVVEIKVDVRSLAQTYHRKREESRDAHLLSDKLQFFAANDKLKRLIGL